MSACGIPSPAAAWLMDKKSVCFLAQCGKARERGHLSVSFTGTGAPADQGPAPAAVHTRTTLFCRPLLSAKRFPTHDLLASPRDGNACILVISMLRNQAQRGYRVHLRSARAWDRAGLKSKSGSSFSTPALPQASSYIISTS